MSSLTHLNARGEARMVDVGAKPVQARRAAAEARLVCAAATAKAIREADLPKGDVLAAARIAGIQAAKRTADLIPLCHPLPLNHVFVDIEVGETAVTVRCEVATSARTGVEMEALTGASVAALTLYDMAKAVDKAMRIDGIRVLEKHKG
ncbi:MAG: cyclic pyranopterin monophosphate synthase MoaC [Opitutales bacterium]|nr:cyclic pyranopterin monophosphate synthase MoaC [Opitutales bacterium]